MRETDRACEYRGLLLVLRIAAAVEECDRDAAQTLRVSLTQLSFERPDIEGLQYRAVCADSLCRADDAAVQHFG